MRRLCLYLLTMVLTVCTVGVNVSVQFCGGELMGVRVNGLHFLSEAGEEMECCTSDDGGCDACHHVSHQYQLQSQYVGGQGVSIAAPWSTVDLGCGPALCARLQSLPLAEGGCGASRPGEGPPGRCVEAPLSRRGLRAPPVWV